MTHALVTIVAPLSPDRIGSASHMIDALGNPARADLKAALDAAIDLDGSATHFASLHALPSFTAGRAHLILEFSADGGSSQAIARLANAIGAFLQPIFALANDWHGGDLGAYLAEHVIPSGYSYGKPAGIGHVGSPGMSVGQIRQEDALALEARKLLSAQGPGLAPMARLAAVRDALQAQFPALLAETPPAPPAHLLPIPAAGLKRLPNLITTFLWPLVVPLLLWVAACGAFAAMHQRTFGPPPHPLLQALHGGWHGLATGLPWVLAVVITVYLRLRWLEALDWVSERFPSQHVEAEMAARENHCAQNHMVSLTRLKPGILRRITIRLAFWTIAQVGSLAYRPGYLGPIGTIHFARWITVPGTRDFIFFSNYGGSWQAYLEDFITLAHFGLTAAWSNTVGFPRTSNLFLQGATDADRFKRYARQSMLPTRFWYSAYPEIDTDMIRANAAIRRGLVGAMSEDDAVAWVSRFGSATRPVNQLATDEIQSLVFGGMGFLPASRMTLWQLPDDRSKAGAFFSEVAQHVAFDDGRRLGDAVEAIVQLAVSAQGLRALGLPEAAMASFPPPFSQGMAAPARARILGDAGPDAPDQWWWGGAGEPHLALIVLGRTSAACDVLEAALTAAAAAQGAVLTYRLPMTDYDPGDNREPFGFVDGISQPVIRGTYKGSTRGDALHLCEPGEFILGYPDNRGETPPGPSVSAGLDPAGKLPVRGSDPSLSTATINHPREIGRNGSYLVIRHLEQDREAFDSYCTQQASQLKHRLPAPYLVDSEFIAAKLLGRWRNGAPIVRAPYSDTVSRAQSIAARNRGAPRDAHITFTNTFLLGEEDPEGLRCPFGAHIRRANPRDSLNPGSADQVAISNRHRILRVGRKYSSGASPSGKPGLVFLCLNADIERQFEFIQQTWIQGNVISLACPISLKGETDPLLGSGNSSGYTMPSHDGLIRLAPPPRFVTVRGGGYFFLAGRSLIAWLATSRTDAPAMAAKSAGTHVSVASS
jgi:Dyp-type peroxidase family